MDDILKLACHILIHLNEYLGKEKKVEVFLKVDLGLKFIGFNAITIEVI
jgi:hypothetical protein